MSTQSVKQPIIIYFLIANTTLDFARYAVDFSTELFLMTKESGEDNDFLIF